MIYLLVAISLILALALARVVYVMRQLESQRDFYELPENFGLVCRHMLETAKRRGRWDSVEAMRHEVRLALSELNRLRHDATNAGLRSTKPINDTQEI